MEKKIAYNQLPNFYIIGAAKCGTTTLAHGLMQHPSIYIPTLKEVAFFNDEDSYNRGSDCLSSFFQGDVRYPLRGDASPQYLYCKHVPARIKELYGDIPLKFVVILRDPLKRTISSYKQACARGGERLELPEAIHK